MQTKLNISPVDVVIRRNRLRWYGHTARMNDSEWPKAIQSIFVDGKAPRGRPRKRWVDCINADMKQLNLKCEDALDRTTWRSKVKDITSRQTTKARGKQDDKLSSK